MGRLPPTQDALLQHARRATYQAGVWCTSEKAYQSLPSPEGWGWTLKDNAWALSGAQFQPLPRHAVS